MDLLGGGRDRLKRGPNRVLVVEESASYAAVIERMLREGLGASVAVDHAGTLARAVSLLAGESSIDCVVLDLSLPDAAALEAPEAVQSAAPEAPVVVLTATDDFELAVRAFAAGAQDYLPKRRTNASLLARALRYAVERKRVELRLAHDALHDGLTGLPNRVLFLDRLAVALERAGREGGIVAVLLIDLDRFSTVNDSLGHEAGDELLRLVAARLRDGLRDGDTVARFGGDEFLMLCDDLASQREALALAHQVRDAIEQPIELAGRELSVTACVGVAFCERATQTASSLVRDADRAMSRAKRRGPGVELFQTGLHAQALRELETEHGLRRAIERDQLRLYYQPEVTLSDGRPFSLEALLRWEHPMRGLLAPAEFIGLAEETGLIVPIGEWVIGEACRALSTWRHDGLVTPDLTVAVNLSPRQFSAPGLTDAVRDALESFDLPARSLCLEVTETSIAQDLSGAAAVLGELKSLGVRIALDDFGTGYSSLSALRRYPLDVVKIDRSFIEQTHADTTSVRMFLAILDLVRAAGLDAVVEGIEERWQLDLLRRARCDSAQGFLFARPAPEGIAIAGLAATPSVVSGSATRAWRT